MKGKDVPAAFTVGHVIQPIGQTYVDFTKIAPCLEILQ